MSLTLVMLTVLASAPGAPKIEVDPVPLERKKLQGEWTLAAQEHGGKSVDPKLLAGVKLTIAGDKVATRRGDEALEEGTLRLSPRARPHKAFDLILTAGDDKGKVVKGIYKLEKDTLTVCIGEPGGRDRPREFA